MPVKINYPGTTEIFSSGEIPDLEQYGLKEPEPVSGYLQLVGGEDAGLRRIQSYFWEKIC